MRLIEEERQAVRNVNWLIDHPDQKPDAVTAEGHLVFHYRKEEPVQKKPDRRQVSILQYDRLVQTRAENLQKKTNESFRKCFFWAQEQLQKVYEIKEEELRKAA